MFLGDVGDGAVGFSSGMVSFSSIALTNKDTQQRQAHKNEIRLVIQTMKYGGTKEHVYASMLKLTNVWNVASWHCVLHFESLDA